MSRFVEFADGATVVNVDRILRAVVNPELYGEDNKPVVEAYFTTNPNEKPMYFTWRDWQSVRMRLGLPEH